MRLLVSLRVGPDLARLGPGARLVALISAAHAGRVALIWPVRAGRRSRARRGSRRVCHTRSSVALPARQPVVDRAMEDVMSSTSDRVVIGMDPHKRSATIEVMSAEETIRGGGRYATDRDGYAAMLRYGGQWPERVWAI